MNTTARRIVTTLAGTALAASAFASTGPAAFAGKDGATQPIAMSVTGGGYGAIGGPIDLSVSYTVPVASTSITSVSCTLDGVQQTYCGDIFGASTKSTDYFGYVIDGEVVHVDHTFAVTVTTKEGIYAGSTTWAWGY